MKMMVTHNMVIVLQNIILPDGFCKVFIIGKHRQTPFDLGKSWNAQERLDIVHNDLCCMEKP